MTTPTPPPPIPPTAVDAGCLGDEPTTSAAANRPLPTHPDLAPGVPPLRSLYFYLTAGCNLRCGHCWYSPAFDPHAKLHAVLSWEHYTSALDQAERLGLTAFKFTGGEPTIHPNLPAMIREARRRKKSLTIETNLTRLSDEMIAELAQNARHTGLAMSTSLDGATAEVHDKLRDMPGTFADTIAGMNKLTAVGIRPQVIFSVQRENVHQVEAIVELALELGAGSVKYNLVAPHIGRGKKLDKHGSVLGAREFIDLGHTISRELAPKYPHFRLHYSWPPAFQTFRELRENPPSGCGLFNILGILADGEISMCGIGRTVPDLNYGHLDADRLAEVWNHHPMIQTLRETIPNRLGEPCNRCIFQTSCIAYCAASNYNSSEGHAAPYWLCDHAYQSGIFPTSRLKQPTETPAAAV